MYFKYLYVHSSQVRMFEEEVFARVVFLITFQTSGNRIRYCNNLCHRKVLSSRL